MNMPILIDYLTFSIKMENPSPAFDVHFVFQFLNLDENDFNNIGSRMHYESCWVNGKGISIYEPYASKREEMGYCVQMSGTGCRFFEETLKDGEFIANNKLWRQFLRRLRSLNYGGYSVNISRIDIAVDDISKDEKYLLNLDDIERAANNREFVSRFRKMYDMVSKNIISGNETGKCIYFGTMKSAAMCRFYDKLAEQKMKCYNDKDKLKELKDIKHWVRMEFVFRRSQAIKVVNAICDLSDFASYYAKLVNGYVRFVNDDNINITRRTLKSWWSDFLGTLERCNLSVGDYKNYSYERLLLYVNKYLSTSIFTVMSRLSPEDFFKMVYESATNRLKSKHTRILNGESSERVMHSFDLWHALNPIPYKDRCMYNGARV